MEGLYQTKVGERTNLGDECSDKEIGAWKKLLRERRQDEHCYVLRMLRIQTQAVICALLLFYSVGPLIRCR